MAERSSQQGVTLIEMMVVLGIIVVLAGLVVTLTLRVDNQSKERALDSAFALLSSVAARVLRSSGTSSRSSPQRDPRLRPGPYRVDGPGSSGPCRTRAGAGTAQSRDWSRARRGTADIAGAARSVGDRAGLCTMIRRRQGRHVPRADLRRAGQAVRHRRRHQQQGQTTTD